MTDSVDGDLFQLQIFGVPNTDGRVGMVDREFADGDIAYGHLFESADVEPNAVYVMCMNTFDDEIAEAGRVVLLAFGLVVGFEFDERPVDSVDVMRRIRIPSI